MGRNNKSSGGGAKYFIIMMMIYAALTHCSNEDINLNRDKSNELAGSNIESMLEEVEQITGIETSNNDNLVIIHAAINNSNLSDEEKAIVYSFADIINDNPYIDSNSAYSSIGNVDIFYVPRPDGTSETILGDFNFNKDIINIYTESDSLKRETQIHELLHCLFTNYRNVNIPVFLAEGVTEILVNEYFTPNPFVEDSSYPYEVALTKLLCEMVGPDRVLEAYTTGNMNVIKDELRKYEGTGDATTFINASDRVLERLESGREIDPETYNYMINYLDTYFNNKYSDDNEKMEIYNYYRGMLAQIPSEDRYTAYWNYIYENGYYERVYFSSKLKLIYGNDSVRDNVSEEVNPVLKK